MRSSCSTYCSILLTQLFYSSCSSCFFMFFHSSYLTYCSTPVYCFSPLDWPTTPLTQPAIPLLLLDLLYSSYSTCCYSYSTYYFAPLVWPTTSRLLLDQLLHSSCSTCCFILLVRPTTFLLFDLFFHSCLIDYIPLAWPTPFA